MNLIDFHVTKIMSEDCGAIYKLYNMTESQVNEETDEWWKEFLLSNGVKQTYEYIDDGGTAIKSEVFNLDQGRKPYYIGYVGQH